MYGVELDSAQPAETGDRVLDDKGNNVGGVTCGAYPPITKRCVALTQLNPELTTPDVAVQVQGEGDTTAAKTHSLPFEDPQKITSPPVHQPTSPPVHQSTSPPAKLLSRPEYHQLVAAPNEQWNLVIAEGKGMLSILRMLDKGFSGGGGVVTHVVYLTSANGHDED